MSGSNWFGNLQLAYKYIVVFLSLLAIVALAGLVKVFFDRRKLKKHTQKDELEAGKKEDTVELTQREKDEGDVFGIRAIEAGFYAGVPQSRPGSAMGSRAGSVKGVNMSSSTLVGGANSPLMKGHSNSTSVLSLNLNQTQVNTPGRTSPPLKLRPSEAEITGRHGAVDMALRVPASPAQPRNQAQTFSGSDSSSEGYTSHRSMSPRSVDFNPEHYAPTPQVAMPDAMQVTYHTGPDARAPSQFASFHSTPNVSTPPSPGLPPVARLPTLPNATFVRSQSPEAYRPTVQTYQPTTSQSAHAISTPLPILQPAVYRRADSDASAYSLPMETETPMQQFYTPYEQQYDFNFSTTDYSSTDNELDITNDARRPSEASTYLPVPSIQSSESRLSEFYDAYYRDSTIAPEATVDVDAKRGVSTIAEIDTPLPSPGFPMKEKADSLFSVKSKVEMSISSPMFLKERPVEREEPIEIKKTWCRARAYGMIAR